MVVPIPIATAVDRGDDRLDVVRQRIEKLDGVGGLRRVGCSRCRLFRKVLEVVAGGEDTGPAGNDEAADLRVVLRGVDRLGSWRDTCPA